MEEFKRNKLTILTSLLAVVLGCLLTFALANKSRDDYDLRQKIDAKVDKIEFNKHVEENNTIFKEFTKKQDEQLTRMNQNIEILLQQSVENRTDISWIKRELKK
jgi:hypothetical protein